MRNCDILIVGGGTAGMAAACKLWEELPEKKILLLERESVLGGVLRQCIHTGFGASGVTGPEYEEQLETCLKKTGIQVLCETEVTEIHLDESSSFVTAASPEGWIRIGFEHMILAAGCYERPIGNLMIAGTRPNGIFGAGQLQKMMNLDGYRPVGRAVMIGSGDIGMIVARRLTINGCEVKRMIEIQEESPALERNKKRCLEAYHLPLQLHSRVLEIHGEKQICGVTAENLDTGVREYIECDFLVVAAGLIPDQVLLCNLPEGWESKITLAGNCEKVYPVADSIVHAVHGKCQKLSEAFKEVSM